jgi:hypothetical protein
MVQVGLADGSDIFKKRIPQVHWKIYCKMQAWRMAMGRRKAVIDQAG